MPRIIDNLVHFNGKGDEVGYSKINFFFFFYIQFNSYTVFVIKSTGRNTSFSANTNQLFFRFLTDLIQFLSTCVLKQIYAILNQNSFFLCFVLLIEDTVRVLSLLFTTCKYINRIIFIHYRMYSTCQLYQISGELDFRCQIDI